MTERAITTAVNFIVSARVGQVTRLSSAMTSFKNCTGATFGIFGFVVSFISQSYHPYSTFAKAMVDHVFVRLVVRNDINYKNYEKTPLRGR
jgi:hypothetical protein